MRILWVCFSYSTSEPWVRSLTEQPHEVEIIRYDTLPMPFDRGILDAADRFKPDIVIYTGAAGGALPSPECFTRIRKTCKTVLFSGDLSDPPWWPFLSMYREAESFDLYVNFDGNDTWPKEGRDFTTLTPIARSFFPNPPPLAERPVHFGWAGTYARENPQDPRRLILDPLVAAGLVVKPWEQQYGTYHKLARFLMNTRVTLSMPWSGSRQSVQVKGKVIEAACAGCVLLDHVSSPTRRWIIEGHDYLEYETAADALETVAALARNPERAQCLANNLQEAMAVRYSPMSIWSEILAEATA